MPEKRLSHTAADLEKAAKIVERHGTFIGPGGSMPHNIALAVADGIVLGRKEGIATAAEAVAKLKTDDDA